MAWRCRKQLDGRHGKRWAGRPPCNPAGCCSCCRGEPPITRTPSVLVGRLAAYGLRRPYAGSSWEKNEREKTWGRRWLQCSDTVHQLQNSQKSCTRNLSHLYKSCSSKKPLPISVRILGSKMQVSRDLELQSLTKIWLLLKIQRCAKNEFMQIQRCYSFLAIVGLRIWIYRNWKIKWQF